MVTEVPFEVVSVAAFSVVWIVTVTLMACVVVVIGWLALTKARPSDVPKVLAALGVLLVPLTFWLPRKRPSAGSSLPGTEATATEVIEEGDPQ